MALTLNVSAHSASCVTANPASLASGIRNPGPARLGSLGYVLPSLETL